MLYPCSVYTLAPLIDCLSPSSHERILRARREAGTLYWNTYCRASKVAVKDDSAFRYLYGMNLPKR